MQESVSLRLQDLDLLHALQLHPRIPWTQLAPVLGVDATTLARRWNQLLDQGLVWSSCYPVSRREWNTMPSSICSLIEVDCVAGQREAVIAEVCGHRGVLNVECTSGSRDLLLTVVLSSSMATDSYVNTVLSCIPGVRATRTYFTRQVHKDGSDWQLDRLGPRQRNAVMRARGQLLDVPAHPSHGHRQVLDLLAQDIRMPVSAIAGHTGRSISSTSRLVKQLMHADWVRTRIEFSHHLVGWDVTTLLWLSVPHHRVEEFATLAVSLPQVRLCCSVLNRANVAITLWLRDFAELDEAESALISPMREVEVVDRWLLPRTAKRLGHTLDSAGRHSGYVPIDLPARS